MVHQSLDTSICAAQNTIGRAEHAAEMGLVVLAFGSISLLLDVRLGKEHPAITDAGHGDLNAGIDAGFHFILLSRVWPHHRFTFEVALAALPDLLLVVVAGWLRAERKALLLVLADCPGALAETPVVVVLARSSVEDLLLAWWPALDRVCADQVVVAHTRSGQNTETACDAAIAGAYRSCDAGMFEAR